MKKLLIFLLFIISCLSNVDIVKINDPSDEMIEVEIRGAVKNPGVYVVKNKASVYEKLKEIGLYDNADLSWLNKKMVFHDKDFIEIFEKKEFSKVSINTGSLKELKTLKGIGESTAKNIIEYRESIGFFQSLEELMEVKGIGLGKFEKIKEDISL
ncbi:MAG: ComEA family DNA-binding protein [Anaerorhabdus sp.]